MRIFMERSRILLLASVLALAVLVASCAAAVPQDPRGAADSESEDVSPGYAPPANASLADVSPEDEQPSFEPPSGTPEVALGRVIVKFKEGATPEDKAAVRNEEGLTRLEELDLINAEVDLVEGRSVEEAVRGLEGRPEVEYVEPDHLVYSMASED